MSVPERRFDGGCIVFPAATLNPSCLNSAMLTCAGEVPAVLCYVYDKISVFRWHR